MPKQGVTSPAEVFAQIFGGISLHLAFLDNKEGHIYLELVYTFLIELLLVPRMKTPEYLPSIKYGK